MSVAGDEAEPRARVETVAPPTLGVGIGGSAFARLQVGPHRFGVPVDHAVEVIEWRSSTPIPLAPAHLPGLVAWRGRPVPLLDLRLFLHLGERSSEDSGSDRALVVSVESMHVALVCDRVLGIASMLEEALGPVEVARGTAVAPYATAEVSEDDGLLVCVDVPALLEAARPKGRSDG